MHIVEAARQSVGRWALDATLAELPVARPMALDVEISPKSSSEGPRGPAEELLIEYSDSTDFKSVDAGRRQRTPSELKQGECF